MKITIDEKLQGTLERLAEGQAMTPQQYATNVLKNHLVAQYKEDLIVKIKNTKLDDLPAFETVINEKVEVIKDRDFVAPTDNEVTVPIFRGENDSNKK